MPNMRQRLVTRFTAAASPSARKMVEAVVKEADTASVALETAKKLLNKGYDESGWSEKQHTDFQKGLEYTFEALIKAKHEALKARRAVDNMKAMAH